MTLVGGAPNASHQYLDGGIMSLKIESVAVEKLESHPNNPRRGDVDTIVESLKTNGQFRPIVISSDNVVLAGNHTLQAAVKLGLPKIDVVRLPVTGDSDEAVRVMLADNRSSDMSTYDDADLIVLLESLTDLEGTGYIPDDLTDLMHISEMHLNADDSSTTYTPTSEDKVGISKNLSVLKDEYAEKSVRSVILAYSLEDFEEIAQLLMTAREMLSLESNADVVLQLLRENNAGN